MPAYSTFATIMMSKRFLGLALVFWLTTILGVFAQRNSSQLERERRENQARINETNRILEETRSKKKATLGQLNALRQEIKQRESQIKSINRQIEILQSEITGISLKTGKLQSDLDNLKAEYAAMVYAAGKADIYSKLMFLLASEDFNQFVARIRYLKQYSAARQRQVEAISRTKTRLIAQQAELKIRSKEKEVLLGQEVDQNNKLVALQGEQREVANQLSAREKELRQELAERVDADRRLEKLIADMIKREMRKAARAAKKPKPKSSEPAKTEKEENIEEEDRFPMTPETEQISNNFSENRSRLVWPVSSGFVSSPFGRQPHPILRNIYIDNLGVDIQTNQGEKVRSIFDGTVEFVASLPGVQGKFVFVRHGEFITVYGNLKDIVVQPGDRVRLKTPIGSVCTDKDGVSTLQFQIWKNNQRLDPENWLARR